MSNILAKTSLQEWGNSLAIRIPKKIKDTLKLHKGSKINISLEGSKIVLESDNDPFFELSNDLCLLSITNKITSKNKHEIDEFEGPAVGKEIW